MYGLIGKIRAVDGEGERLADLLAAIEETPGCISYVAARDAENADVVWVTEIWESAEAHVASLELAAVQAAIVHGRQLIAAFEDRHETVPIGGVGIPGADQDGQDE